MLSRALARVASALFRAGPAKDEKIFSKKFSYPRKHVPASRHACTHHPYALASSIALAYNPRMNPVGNVSDGNSYSQEPQGESWTSFFLYLAIAGAIAFGIRTYIVAPYIVVGASMEPTFDNYHYLLIDKLTYRFAEPQRGDVLVLDLPQNESRALIKRLVGLPGDTVIIKDNHVIIEDAAHPQGFTLDEPYLSPENLGGATDIRVTLRPGEYYVLGDNRRVSSDSRIWGVLPKDDVVGRVFIRLFPFDKLGIFPGEARYQGGGM